MKITREFLLNNRIPLKKPGPIDKTAAANFPREGGRYGWQVTVEGWIKPLPGWKVYHTWMAMHSTGGFPDIVAVNAAAGRCFYAELKSETGIVTPEQVDWLTALALAGEEVYLWRPSDEGEIIELLREIEDERRVY